MSDTITGAYPGHLAYEYINTGTYDTPTWVRIQRVEDVDLPDERSGSDLKIKGSDFVAFIRGPRTTSIAFKYKKKRATDAVFAALEAQYNDAGAAPIDYMALNQPATVDGAKGFRGPYNVTKFSESRPYENAVEVDVELKFADADLAGGAKWERTAVTMSA